jgi:hypothetical protein
VEVARAVVEVEAAVAVAADGPAKEEVEAVEAVATMAAGYREEGWTAVAGQEVEETVPEAMARWESQAGAVARQGEGVEAAEAPEEAVRVAAEAAPASEVQAVRLEVAARAGSRLASHLHTRQGTSGGGVQYALLPGTRRAIHCDT